MNDVLLWTPTHGRTSVGQPARTYLNQQCVNAGCGLEDLPGVMVDRDGCCERVREINTVSVTWWWW